MTHFKIVSCGWNNWPYVIDTVESIQAQEWDDFEFCVVDDASEDPEIFAYLTSVAGSDDRLRFIQQTEHRGGLYNQVAAIRAMNPDPEDVIVFVDADGDRLAHSHVLANLDEAYADGTQLVYTQYDTDPPGQSPGSIRSRPYPPWVIERNAYREFTRDNGIYWNHLRTFKARLFLQLEDTDFQDDSGDWFRTVTDSALMFPCLELARGQVKFHDEVCLIYRADHDLSDWRRFGDEVGRHNHTILTRSPK